MNRNTTQYNFVYLFIPSLFYFTRAFLVICTLLFVSLSYLLLLSTSEPRYVKCETSSIPTRSLIFSLFLLGRLMIIIFVLDRLIFKPYVKLAASRILSSFSISSVLATGSEVSSAYFKFTN